MEIKKSAFSSFKAPPAAVVDRLWKGSIDMHIHFAPDANMDRRYDGLECALEARNAGMRGLVLKCDFSPTTLVAFAAQRAVPEVDVFGSINIESCTTGGLGEHTAETIEVHAKMGCKVVWFPTFDSVYSRKYAGKEGGLTVLQEDGALKPVVYDILDVVKKYNMVLCNGHLSPEETIALFTAAREKGITKMVVTHAMVDVIWPPFTMEEMKTLVDMGAYIEHTYRNCLPLVNSYSPLNYVNAIHELGAEHTIISTDFGQISDSSPAEGMRTFIATMLQMGVSEENVSLMVKTNPAKLLDLEL